MSYSGLDSDLRPDFGFGSPETQVTLVPNLELLQQKGITQEFLEKNRDLITQLDDSKEGVEIFKTETSLKKWFAHCAEIWIKDPENINFVAMWFEKGLIAEKEIKKPIFKQSIHKTLLGARNSFSRYELEEISDGIQEAGEQDYSPEFTVDNVTRRITRNNILWIRYKDITDAPLARDKSRIRNLISIKNSFPNAFHFLVKAHYDNLFLELHTPSKAIRKFAEISEQNPDYEAIQKAYLINIEKYTYPNTYFAQENFIDEEGQRLKPGQCFYNLIHSIYEGTGVDLDEEILDQNILGDKNFSLRLPFKISTAKLDQHFSKEENRLDSEYERIYSIFACYDYYLDVLDDLEKDSGSDSKIRIIQILTSMALTEGVGSSNYITIKNRIFSYLTEIDPIFVVKASVCLAKLAEKGDSSVVDYFRNTIKSKQIGAEEIITESQLNIQESVALEVMMIVDSENSNLALLSILLKDNIDQEIKIKILQALFRRADFFPPDISRWITYKFGRNEFHWQDLSFFYDILRISNADVRKKSLNQFYSNSGVLSLLPESVVKIHQEYAPNIPKNVFMQLIIFVRYDFGLLRKFNEVYESMRGSKEEEDLLVAIVNFVYLHDELQLSFINFLSQPDLDFRECGNELVTIINTIMFLEQIDQLTEIKFLSQLIGLINRDYGSLKELRITLKKFVMEKLQHVFPDEGIDDALIQNLYDHWGDISPLFIYASKMMSSGFRDTLKFTAQMIAHMDAPFYEYWKIWRYDTADDVVHEQIGFLNDDQMEVWKKNQMVDLGEVRTTESLSKKPDEIFSLISDSVLDRHVYDKLFKTAPKYKRIHEKLFGVFSRISQNPENRVKILSEESGKLRSDIEIINDIISYGSLPRLEEAYAMFDDGRKVHLSKRTSDQISFISKFLSQTQVSQLKELYESAINTGETSVDSSKFITKEIRQSLNLKILEIKSRYESALSSDLLDKYGLNVNEIKNTRQIYDLRRELQSELDLYRLCQLDERSVADNLIEKAQEKNGQTITRVIDNLLEYFKDNETFIQDLENIKENLSRNDLASSNRKLGIVVTDNPQVLFQIGKYPVGCRSCQNYEGASRYNRALAGYVGDAHTKVVIIFDILRLPHDVREQILETGLEKNQQLIKPIDLLTASVSRAVIKLARTSTDSPVILIEPTYTQIHKADRGMDKYIEAFVGMKIAHSMDSLLSRAGGPVEIVIPQSRNPQGQYEDGGAILAGDEGMGVKLNEYTMSVRLIDPLGSAENNEILSNELLIETRGKWVKYPQGSSEDKLVDSLINYQSEWGIAISNVAHSQLKKGDIYIYYSLDDQGIACIPRLALRMSGQDVFSDLPLGIAPGEKIDPYIVGVLNAKILEFGQEGRNFMRKSHDMNKLERIWGKHSAGIPLSYEDLRFIYEFDSKIMGFTDSVDPRLELIKESRDLKKDLLEITGLEEGEISTNKTDATKDGIMFHYGDLALDCEFADQIHRLPNQIFGNLFLSNLKSARGLKLPKIVEEKTDLSGLKSAEGLELPANYYRSIDLSGLKSAKGLHLPKYLAGDLDLSGLTSAEDLVLPETIQGDLKLTNLESAKGLVFPKNINGLIDLRRLLSAEDVVFPERVAGLLLNDLESASGVKFPDHIQGDLSLSHLKDSEGLSLPSHVAGTLGLHNLKSIKHSLKMPSFIGGDLFLSNIVSAEDLVLPEVIGGSLFLSRLLSADGVTFPKTINGDFFLSRVERIVNATLPEKIVGQFVMMNLISAKHSTFPNYVGGSLLLPELNAVENTQFPEEVNGNVDLRSLVSGVDLVLPKKIDGSLDLKELVSATNMLMPEYVGKHIDLRNLKSILSTLVMPKTLGLSLYLDSLISAENLVFPETIGEDLMISSMTSLKGVRLPRTIAENLLISKVESIEGVDLPESIGGYIEVGNLSQVDIDFLKAKFNVKVVEK